MTGNLLGNLPLQYNDGPDFCTVKDATGGDFALTVQPELLQLMEKALYEAAAAVASIRSRVGQIKKANETAAADSSFRIENACDQLLEAAASFERAAAHHS
jgi:hypothetical protein